MSDKTAPLTQDEIVKQFMAKPTKGKSQNKIENNEAKKLDEINNVVVLPNGYKLKINPTKIKYFRSGDFSTCSLIKAVGLINLISKYMDGYDVLAKFLSAVFDKPYTQEQVKAEDSDTFETKYVFDESVTNLIDNELSPVDIENIIDIALKVNHIEAENFLIPLLNNNVD